MAFEDFKIGEQIITYTDFDKVKIKAGELASASNFNRSIVDSMNRDAALEAAVTYIARSSSLYTTKNTRFLSHCEPVGGGADIIGSCYPNTNNASADVVFADDETFLGAAYIRSEITNVLGVDNAVDASMGTNVGWEKSTTAKVTPVWLNDGCTTVSTKITTVKATVGTTTINTVKLSLDELGLAIGDTISGSFHLETEDNLTAKGVSVHAEIIAYSYDGSTYTRVSKKSGSNISGTKYNGEVKVEGYTFPVGTTHIEFALQFEFSQAAVSVAIFVTNALLHKGNVCMPYIAVSGGPYSLKYEDAIDYTLGANTTLCWSKFTQSGLDSQVNDITPMMIKIGSKYYGLVHTAGSYSDDGDLVLKSVCINTSSGNTATSGSEITIPASYIDDYILLAYRVRVNEEDVTKAVIELAAVCGANIYKSAITDTIDVAATELTSGDIYVGFGPSCGYLNGPVTEIRSDNEWLNDTELYVISLSKKAYTLKQSIDIDENDDDNFNKISANLLLNPTGKLGYVGWSDYKTIKAIHNDGLVGNGFELRATTPLTEDTAIKMISTAVEISAGNLYALWCNMLLTEDASGEAGMGITWYKSTGIEISTQTIPAVATGTNDYYALNLVAPTGAASARVFIYANVGFTASRILWSKLKLEHGDPSEYTEDSGAQYAVYYDKDADTDIDYDIEASDIYVKNASVAEALVSDSTLNKIFILGTPHQNTAVDTVVNSATMYFDTKDNVLYATSSSSLVVKPSSVKTLTKSSTTPGETSSELPNEGLTVYEVYGADSGGPTTYGNVLGVRGATHPGGGELFLGWSGTDSATENLYYRSHRDMSSGGWGPWKNVVLSSGGTVGSYKNGVYLNNGVLTACTQGNVPPGTILMYAGKTMPDGFVLCNGSQLNKNSYPDLFNVIGYTYGGSGDIFRVPNLVDRFVVGAGSSYGLSATGGEATHRLTVSEMPSHAHGKGTMNITGSFAADNTQLGTSLEGSSYGPRGAFTAEELGNFDFSSQGGGYRGGRLNFNAAANGAWTGVTSYVGDNGYHENRPPYFALYYMIKV